MKRKFIMLLITALTLLTTFTLGATMTPSAIAQSHYTHLDFSSAHHYGQWRDYTHSHIQWFATVSSPADGTLNIALYRRNGTGDGYRFGTARQVTRNGIVMVHWNNAGAGSRRFRFNKANDGITVSSPNVVLSSSSTPYSHTKGTIG